MPWEALAATAYGSALVAWGWKARRERRLRVVAAGAIALGALAALGGLLLLLGQPAGRGVALLPAVIVLLVVGWWLAQGMLQEQPDGLGRSALLMAASGLVAALLVTGGCAPAPGVPAGPASPAGAPGERVPGIEEPSGVTRSGDRLLVVGDGEEGTWYSLPASAATGGRVPLAPAALTRHRLAGLPDATDLEAIGVLADGRVVVLSEDLHALLDDHGVVARYEDLEEIGGRGCEGLDIRDLGGGDSRVAVLWEGGYLDDTSPARVPRVFVHDVPAGASGLEVTPGTVDLDVRLHVPLPAGREPQAQRFRCPDLVWHRLRPGDPDSWGFIVLLSSGWAAEPSEGSPEECPKESDGRPLRWCYKWIQRFDLDGEPMGEPVDLDPYFPDAVRTSNWEGMGWFETGRSLVFVYDESVQYRVLDPQVAVVVPLPEGW